METLTMKEIVGILVFIENEISNLIDDIHKKVIIGEINRPEVPKAKRAYRKKVKFQGTKILEVPSTTLPEDQNTFYVKPKKGRRKNVTDDQIDVQS